jgi:hypothetical protein
VGAQDIYTAQEGVAEGSACVNNSIGHIRNSRSEFGFHWMTLGRCGSDLTPFSGSQAARIIARTQIEQAGPRRLHDVDDHSINCRMSDPVNEEIVAGIESARTQHRTAQRHRI